MGGVWMMRFRRISDLKYVGVMLLAFLVGAIFSPTAYMERLATIGDAFELVVGDAPPASRTEAELGTRLEVMKAAVGAFFSSPVGAGVANFGPWAVKAGYKMSVGHSPHNAVLQVASEYGIIGLVPYLTILVMTWTHLGRAQRIAHGLRMRRDRELELLQMRALMVQLGYLGILIVAQFQPGFFWKGMWASFGLSTAVLALTERRAHALRAAEPVAAAPLPEPGGRLRAEPA
jgi:O-antigen ligase